MVITSIEKLSNEFFYEIFDYLDGVDIYHAFSNLNYRFQQLLNSSYLLFKIKVCSPSDKLSMDIYKQTILLNRHNIFSFYLSLPLNINQFFSSFTFDSSLDRLESLDLSEIEPTLLFSLLSNITSLPRLFSLTIDTSDMLKELNEVYRLIFALPKLRYIKCSADDSDISVSLSIAINKQFSTIEHLIIDHCCTFNELFAILSYTPQLRYLKSEDANNNNNSTIESRLPITLSNLTYLFICTPDATFAELEIFISKIDCKLKVLSVTNLYDDADYLDANRWARLILQYWPQLEKFYFEFFDEQIDYSHNPPPYLGDLNKFTSSFWIERQWIFEAEIDSREIMYSIRPYRKRWCDINSPIEFSKSTRLILTHIPSVECLELLMKDIRAILTLTCVYQLEIARERIFFSTLVEIIQSLPELDSLKIHSLSLSQSRCLSVEERILHFVSSKNKITKVYLEKMFGIEEVYFLIKLCPRMNHLQMNCINNMNVELFLKNILMKIKDQYNGCLRLLCFRVPSADDKMVQKLEEMINCKKLLLDYTIKRVLDRIYLQWR